MARLRVKHLVLCNTVRQYHGVKYSDLLGASYFYHLPADTEFPYRVSKLEVFVRFLARDLKPTRVRLTVTALDARAAGRVYNASVVVNHDSVVGRAVIDRGYKLVDFLLPAEGRYRIRVYRLARQPFLGLRWRRLATEAFWVERAT